MENANAIVFLTDKNGRKNKTDQIENISFNPTSSLWEIKFFGDGRTFHYKTENVQVIKNCLQDKHSAAVFDYILQMAQFSDIKNDEGQNLLVKNVEKSRFINRDSALSWYLNPKNAAFIPRECGSLSFPFGCNNSQLTAVKTALENKISIIQGPPGTGKTQTILNIIANLLLKNKSVLVVSNNNAATANVYEKLSSLKYQLDFLCATLGKKENVDAFLAQQNTNLPPYLSDWKTMPPIMDMLIDNDVSQLEVYFRNQERLSQVNSELAAIEVENHYFIQEKSAEHYKSKKLNRIKSDSILALMQTLQFQYNEKEKFSFFAKFKLKAKTGFGGRKFWTIDEEKVLDSLRFLYYEKKLAELSSEKEELTQKLKTINPETVYIKCLHNLKYFIADKYLKKEMRSFFKDGAAIYHYPEFFVNEYPVILSTTFSARQTLGSSSEFLFDYVIMDEASQVDVVTGALALSCAKNAVIVGDKMQLPNVIEEARKPIIRELFEKTKLPEGYNFLNSFLASLEQVLPETPQTLLREHYRCHPKIINFCNQQFYGGKLLIMTEDKGELDVLQAIKTVPGDFCKNRYNQRQIDVIKEELLPNLSREEVDNLGIIAPYNNQTDAIKEQIKGIDAATVHKYQGREKDCIIISTTDNVPTVFSDDSNLLNVAISRAKKKLALVISGNDQPESSNLSALLKYIEYNNFRVQDSKVNSIFDFFYTKNSKAKFEYLFGTKLISKYNSENMMNALLERICNEAKYARFNFAFEMPLKDVVSSKYIETLPLELKEYASRSWSHVDFVVFNRVTKDILFGIEVDGYTYHKKGTKQAKRDKKKNAIFELIGLPLLRLSTKGSGEEQKIRELMNSYLGIC